MIGFICLVIAAALTWVWLTVLEGEPPSIHIETGSSSIGTGREISGTVSDQGTGLRKFKLAIVKDANEHILLEKSFSSAGLLRESTVHEEPFSLRIDPQKIGIEDGRAVLRMEAWDYSWRGWWHGNLGLVEKEITIDTRPPEVEVLSRAHNIRQGGSGVVIYRVSESDTESGVCVGENYFPAYSGCFDDKNILIAFFALSYKQGAGTEMFIKAVDSAGNSKRAGFPHYIKPQKFKKDLIPISDRFLDRKMPEFDAKELKEAQASAVEKFLIVNTKLRPANSRRLLAVGDHTDRIIHWKGEFLRLPHSATRAMFADHRSYQYNGRIIDQQVHLGIDLASLQKSPVPAANSGRVAFAGDVGIYGKTIVIDHGFGLFSAYSHLSRMNAHEGDQVAKGNIIGDTGQTGLAGGDHLHYGMFVHNTFVNPLEWWDPAWIKNNVTSKIEAVKTQLREERNRR